MLTLNKSSHSKRCLALDYGHKRVGVAISDPEKTVAFPREILVNADREDLLKKITELIKEEEVGTVIVGWPVGMNGEPTQQTRETGSFIEDLKTHLRVEIIKMDERLTSVQAARTGGQDDVAAQIILKTYLDRKKQE